MKKALGILVLYFLTSCKKEKVEFLPVAEVSLTVLNDRNEPVNWAQVMVFDNQKDYEESLGDLSPKNTIVNTTTATRDGKDGVAFFQLAPNKSHFLYITYYDNIRNIRFTNTYEGNIINPLPVRTTAYLKVKLAAEDGNIIFYANSSSKIPVSITVISPETNNSGQYSLNEIYTGGLIPDVNSRNILKVAKSEGTYLYYAKSNDGCFWAGKVLIKKGGQTVVNFNDCKGSVVKFYAPSIDPSLFPLKVILNNKEEVGSIATATSSASCDLYQAGELSVFKDAGFYSYKVTSVDNKCVWTGSFTIMPSACIIISIAGFCKESER
mgnify:CR=1 FL=1